MKMSKQIKTLSAILLLQASCATVYADDSSAGGYKGTGTAKYSWSVDSTEQSQAEQSALQNAIETWVAKVHPKHYKNYDKVKSDIDANINDYVLNYTVIDTIKMKDTKTLKVVVRAELNEPKLFDKLIGAQGNEGGDAYIVFVFVAREHAGTVSQTHKEASQTKSQTKEIGKSSQDNSSSLTKSETKTIGTSGKEYDLADQTLWRGFRTNEINTAVGAVLTDAEYAVLDADLIVEETGGLFDVDSFIHDYEKGDDLSPSTKSDALKGLKSLDDPIQYMAIGTLDVDKITVDDVTGLTRVAVSVTGQVLDVKRRGSAVAKVGPTVYSGMGDTPLVAKNNALKKAAEDVATELVARLSSRSIR